MTWAENLEFHWESPSEILQRLVVAPSEVEQWIQLIEPSEMLQELLPVVPEG